MGVRTMKQSITISEVIRFINESHYHIHINELYSDAIYNRFSDIPYNDGGFVQWIEESNYPHGCESFIQNCETEKEALHEKMNILIKLFEIDCHWKKELEYQEYIWREAKTYCTNPDCHENSYTQWCCHNDSFRNGDVKNCNDIESVIIKEAEEFAQEMYDEDDDIQRALYRKYKKEMCPYNED